MATSFEHRNVLIEKSADQSITNSTTLTNDSLLFVDIKASEVWKFRFYIPFNVAGTTSGFKLTVTGPSSPTSVRWSVVSWNGVAVATLSALSTNAFATSHGFAVANAGDHWLVVEGTVENGVNAGNIQFQFAQNTADAVNSVAVRRGALLDAMKIG